MTISPEALNAITAALIAVIVSTFQWLVQSRVIPRLITNQINFAERARQDDLDEQKKEREQNAELVKATIDSVKSQQGQNDQLIKSVVSLVEIHAKSSAEVTGIGTTLVAINRNIAETVEATGDLSENLSDLLNIGSKPLQQLVSDMAEARKEILGARDLQLASLKALDNRLNEMQIDLMVIKKNIEDRIRIATQEVHILPLPTASTTPPTPA
jgi:uncharacterized membrane protein YccC